MPDKHRICHKYANKYSVFLCHCKDSCIFILKKQAVADYIQRSLFSRPVEPFYGLWLLSSRRKYVYDTPMRTAKKKKIGKLL